MNKILKTLFSVLLIGLVALSAVPATVTATDYAAITDLSVSNVNTAANVITLDFDVQNTGNTDVIVDITVKGDDVDTVTHEVTIDADTITQGVDSIRVPLSGILTEGNTIIAVTIVATTGILDEGTVTAKAIAFDVEAANPVELLENAITDVDVEDKDLTFNDELMFEIEVEVDANEIVEDAYLQIAIFDEDGAKVEGWIESENDNIRFDDEDEEVFDQNDFETILRIPSVEDIDEGFYTLHVEVYGDYEEYHDHLIATMISSEFEVEKLENHLNIERVSLDQQGSILYTAILVENDGEENQDDIRAQVRINGLEVKQTSNTVTIYEDDDEIIYVPVVLPNFGSGEYDIKVTVYNDDVSVATVLNEIELTGVTTSQQPAEAGLIVSIDSAVKTVSDNGAVYALTFTNQGNVARTFSIETAGAEWGQASVNPGTVIVGGSASEIASVFVAPNAGEQGVKQFTLFIKEGNQIIKSIALTANVEGSANEATGASVIDFDNLVGSGLKWVAAILVVVLIVLFVMWSWSRVDEEEL